MMDEPVATSGDVELVASIQQGQSHAEAALYERYAARVYYLALRESRSTHDAEDVRAETFLRVLQAIRNNHLRSPESLALFILGTTRNVLRELYVRRRQAQQTDPPEVVELPAPSHEQHFLDSEVQRAIERTIVRLKPRERDLLRLHYYEELPTHEIARRVGVAPERVRLVKSRALKHFREAYQKINRSPSAKKLDTKGS
jgi:RNA polymerase sigma factor (sigma-70 family)